MTPPTPPAFELLLTGATVNARKAYFSVIFELTWAEVFSVVKSAHHGCVCELTLHE